jgi:hypothetical protein
VYSEYCANGMSTSGCGASLVVGEALRKMGVIGRLLCSGALSDRESMLWNETVAVRGSQPPTLGKFTELPSFRE